MPDARKLVDDLLKTHGAILKRANNHEVWELPNGNSFTRAKTPSDAHSEKNNLSDLKRALGIQSHGFQEGERRERKLKRDRPEQPARAIGKTVGGALQEKLLASGLVADGLSQQVDSLKGQTKWLAHERVKLKLLVAGNSAANRRRKLALKKSVRRCWWCQLCRWVRKVRGARP